MWLSRLDYKHQGGMYDDYYGYILVDEIVPRCDGSHNLRPKKPRLSVICDTSHNYI